jgi:hypothetical protein
MRLLGRLVHSQLLRVQPPNNHAADHPSPHNVYQDQQSQDVGSDGIGMSEFQIVRVVVQKQSQQDVHHLSIDQSPHELRTHPTILPLQLHVVPVDRMVPTIRNHRKQNLKPNQKSPKSDIPADIPPERTTEAISLEFQRMQTFPEFRVMEPIREPDERGPPEVLDEVLDAQRELDIQVEEELDVSPGFEQPNHVGLVEQEAADDHPLGEGAEESGDSCPKFGPSLVLVVARVDSVRFVLDGVEGGDWVAVVPVDDSRDGGSEVVVHEVFGDVEVDVEVVLVGLVV